jgi:DNA modification methylase
MAGCPENGIVLDPFAGSGTTGKVAEELGRNSILIELNPKYISYIKERTAQRGLFCKPETNHIGDITKLV